MAKLTFSSSFYYVKNCLDLCPNKIEMIFARCKRNLKRKEIEMNKYRDDKNG